VHALTLNEPYYVLFASSFPQSDSVLVSLERLGIIEVNSLPASDQILSILMYWDSDALVSP
jgi:hypothetical protein